MPITIIKKDITTVECDIMVNPTDPGYSGGGGVDYAIHTKAGEELELECENFAPIYAGEVKLSAGYALPCKYIIHTVGPVWEGGKNNEAVLLRSCYINSMMLAVLNKAKSIAFPLISSGALGFPKDKVLKIANDAISDFLMQSESDIEVYICIIDKEAFTVPDERYLEEYISDNIQCDCILPIEYSQELKFENTYCNKANIEESLESFIKKQDDNFAVTLMKLIDKKGMTDVACYKKANVSRKTFSKLNTDKNYKPSKQTVIAFAIALELNLEETDVLLNTAGFSLSPAYTFDKIIEYFISNGIYDIFEINAALYKYDQVCLGC